MASVTSRPSPKSSSPYDFDETEESWNHVAYPGAASAPSSIGFLPSPASGSLNGYAVVGHVSANTPSPSAASPLLLGEMEQAGFYPGTSFPSQSETAGSDVFATTTDGGMSQWDASFLTPQQYLFSQQDISGLTQQGVGEFSQQELNDMAPLMNNFPTDMFSLDQLPTQGVELNIPQPYQSDPNVPPWNPNSPRGADAGIFMIDDLSSSPSLLSQSSTSPSPNLGPSSRSPVQMRRVKVGKVEKRKSPDQSGKFVIVTPTSISAHAGRPNPFECFDALRTSQRGRKGPLANATKENALQVRRRGACFCCHSRKVKCDTERPCKNCTKLMIQVPQVVCWRFHDFLPILFPTLMRGHLKKDEMTKFIRENVVGFTVDGVEQACSVQLYAGLRFKAVLTAQAKFFTPKTCDVLQHMHMNLGGFKMDLQTNGSAAIGIEMDISAERDSLKKATKVYIQEIIKEPEFVNQVTDSFENVSLLPKQVLKIVQTFADQSDATMVKRSLSIYCMHYIMTHHLCLTRNTIDALSSTGRVPQNNSNVTSRVLSRQIKSIVDEMMMREVSQLFELFNKSLKPKSRREWAPCLAAFLVLCLFMEAVEVSADVFVVAENKVSMDNGSQPEYKRSLALDICKEVENMPFKQFAYQFHQVYQTHSKDANTKSFNPIFDPSFAEKGELDPAAIEMASELTEMFYGETWQSIMWLTDDDILPNDEPHLYVRDPQHNYTGRLVAKFLRSFYDEKFIFGGST
ncbi:hypothetical protein G7046_g8681 [Stylonectria norvegica]|nr:hypothetical protein G7046_g8681 [Stylonectria norvegica]